MRSSGLKLMLALLSAANGAVAQGSSGEASGESSATAPSDAAAPEAEQSAPEGPAAPEPAPTPGPESAPAPEKSPERAPANELPLAEPIGPAKEVAPQATGAEVTSAPWIRAHSPLTLDGRLGLSVRPESSSGFDEESHIGSELGLSLYMDLKRELAVGLELERASLGHGSAISGTSTVSVDYSASSALLGFRAYPKRGELVDLFVGLQVGLTVQGVSAAGMRSPGALLPAKPYKCGGFDSPGFQIGGGVSARVMISPRWGITGRVNAAGRRLTDEMVYDCAQGIGTATTISASLGLGYDFDLDSAR